MLWRMPSALSDVVVLELATGVAGAYAGRVLSDLGAQVIKVEPPRGDPLRTEPPIANGESAFFAYLNAGKYAVALSLDDQRLEDLLPHADIVIHSERGQEAELLDERIANAAPQAVVVSVTPYGRSGDRAGWEATELIEYATGGYHYFGGDPNREPLALPGYQAGFHAGIHAANAALAGLWEARASGLGQFVELSQQEGMLSDHAWLSTMWTHTGQVQRRTGSLFARCADGFIFLFPLVPYQNLFVLMERFDVLEDEALFEPLNWQVRFPEVLAMFSEWAATRTKQEIYHAAQELRVAVSPLNDMADLLESPQLRAREWWSSVEVGGESYPAPGFPYRLVGTPCAVQFPVRKPGEDTERVCDPEFDWANAHLERPEPQQTVRTGPLDGVRVIEMTANWAGPQAGKWLADLGADVIKIELQTKPATRALIYAGGELLPDHYHRAGYFNKHNRNKRGIALDLSKPLGRETFLRLVADADVVLENNAARVMSQLRLDYPVLSGVNPRIVMCSMSGYGATGPDREYSAYGSNIESASGLASVLGYGPGEYFGTGTFYADPITGNHGFTAILAALHHARRTGEGQWIDMALLEAVIPLFAQPFLEFAVTGEVPAPRGNGHPTFSPQGLYRCAGADNWVALSCRNDDDWRAICGVLGRDDLASQGVEWRRENAATVNEAIATWALPLEHTAAANRLQGAGVPAAPVMANWEIVSDNHLNDRGFFHAVRHPVAGTFQMPGFPWKFSRTPATIRAHAPLFAQHNREVFAGVLNMAEDEIARLYEEGITGDEPIYTALGTL